MTSLPRTDRPRDDRSVGVHALWRRVRSRRRRALAWIESPRKSLDAISLLVAIATGISLTPLDAVFRARPEPIAGSGATASSALVWLLLAALVALAQALLVDRFIAERWSARGLVASRWRWLRMGLAAIPLFGLYAIPAWQWLVARRADAPEATSAARLDPPSTTLGATRTPWAKSRLLVGAARRLSSGGGMGALFVSGFAALFGLSLVLPGLCPTAGPGRLAVLATALTIHLASAGAAGVHLWIYTRRLRLTHPVGVAATALALCWLVPVTGAAFAGLVAYVLALSLVPDPAQRALSGRALGGAAAVRALPRWHRLVTDVTRTWDGVRGWRALRRPTGLRAPRSEGGIEARFFSLCRGKTALLFLETSALAWLLATSVTGDLLLLRIVEAALRMLGALSLAVGTLGLATMAVGLVGKILRPGAESASSRSLFASAPYWAGTLLAAGAGLRFGRGLAAGDLAAAGGLLALVGAIGATIGAGPTILRIVLPIPPASAERERWSLLSTLFFCGVGITGLGIAGEEPGPWSAKALMQLLWLGPAASIALGAAGSGWLRRAFGVGRRQTIAGPRPRWARPWLTATAVLPFGALAVPLWVLAWHRRRLPTAPRHPGRRRGRGPGSRAHHEATDPGRGPGLWPG